MSAETAVFVEDLSTLTDLEGSYDRVYVGNEFCDKRMPAAEEVLAVYAYCEERGLPMTYVTPILTPTKTDEMRANLDALESVAADVELVVNDWGVYAMATDRGFADLVAGRVLSRQKRDPTVSHLQGETDVDLREDADAVSDRVLEHFQKSVLDAPYSRAHLEERGVGRVELDVLTQGVSDADVGLSASLYYPWTFVTVRRWCRESSSAPLCNEACSDRLTSLDNRPVMPELLYRKNNVVFTYTETVPEVPAVDRTVYLPEPIN